ncbi:MAG: hypothetical protein B7Y56_10815 [Gallionellales bacterium 35-53-114]|jgi:hypothetical protein|nr:MAG: hypothetical protein B7Y56_10815 [Gallionellales bacterium 35-53-114]OYZ64886.1 MAG: hypothetical protein B7Y04_03785 [Gallionellales bacterium 24-53-125]OZB07576.1 MAG: hypothetical protein B7X61_13230 [Gallionellales bacterium 39-52-133]HQS58744.1 hypothetical protein [Gallionellaceae bacterium]HQS75084.1 hypothetical protein [Gallionellaceae bacterium]
MNPQINLRYPHSSHPPVLRDMRKYTIADIKLDHCYFVGFRISAEPCYRYHRALLLTDDYDSLLQGINQVRMAIMEKDFDLFDSDVVLIFMRSLKMESTAIVNSRQMSNMDAETEEILSRRNDNMFAVFGLLGDEIFLEQTHSRDALAAIKLAYSRCPTGSTTGFMPLEVCQAHPVTQEFNRLFQVVANQLKCLLSATLSDNPYQH